MGSGALCSSQPPRVGADSALASPTSTPPTTVQLPLLSSSPARPDTKRKGGSQVVSCASGPQACYCLPFRTLHEFAFESLQAGPCSRAPVTRLPPPLPPDIGLVNLGRVLGMSPCGGCLLSPSCHTHAWPRLPSFSLGSVHPPSRCPSYFFAQVICKDWSNLAGKNYIILNMAEDVDCVSAGVAGRAGVGGLTPWGEPAPTNV